MEKKKFATAINCMDGRVQGPVNQYIREKYAVDYVDVITEAGPNKILADNSNPDIIDSIKKRLEISINKHGSRLVAVVGHFDCAGNPVEVDEQTKDTLQAVENIRKSYPELTVIGLWVGEDWQVKAL